MVHQITFNRTTSVHADEDREWNVKFLKTSLCAMQDLLKTEGHLYLNQIYEILGIKQDHRQGDWGYTLDNDKPVEFSIIHGTELTVLIES